MNRTIYQYENKSRPVQEPSTSAKSRQDFPVDYPKLCFLHFEHSFWIRNQFIAIKPFLIFFKV